MQKLFNKILVPVRNPEKRGAVIESACAIANKYTCSIHLFHTSTSGSFTDVSIAGGLRGVVPHFTSKRWRAKNGLAQICDYLLGATDDGVTVSYSMRTGDWEENLVELIKKERYDLVLMGQRPRFSWTGDLRVNASQITRRTNVPVITVPAGNQLSGLCSIVIPVTDFLPVRKLVYGIYIATNFDASIKLLGIGSAKNAVTVQHYLQKAFKLVQDHCPVKVSMEKARHSLIPAALRDFIKRQPVDLLIVNPGYQIETTTHFSYWPIHFLSRQNGPPVLTINHV